MAISYFED